MNDEKLDRFARGELSSLESRELARKALEDPELFDELTQTSIARRALSNRVRGKVRWRRIATWAIAASVILGVALYTTSHNAQLPRSDATISAPPILLARGADSNGVTFRGADPDSRPPRAAGFVESITDGSVTIDLGSLDGLEQGSEADVVRDGQVIGKIKLSTIFRNNSRGEIASGSPIRPRDQVRVPPAALLRGILDQIDAAIARGDAATAMKIAQQASVEVFDAASSSAEDWNNAGVIAELHGDKQKAIEFYERASQSHPSAENQRAIEKNLARLRGPR
jgi:tetratricopeptide (TPR) repeat protein